MEFFKIIGTILSILWVGNVLIADGQEQYLELYTNTTHNNSGCTIIFRESQPDMGVYNSCLFRHYTLGLRGRILLYKSPNFTTYSGYGWSTVHTVAYPFNQWWATSLRFVGVIGNFTASSINLYERAGYEGKHTLITSDTPNFTDSFGSVKVTGPSGNEDWTVYTLANYAGFSFCVKHPAGIADLQTETGIPPGSIKSFKAGCHSRNHLPETHNANAINDGEIIEESV